MRKSNKSFLSAQKASKKMNAMHVVNSILFFGVLSLFIITLAIGIKDIVEVETKSQMIVPLLQRIFALLLVFVPVVARKIFKVTFPKFATSLYYLFLLLSLYLGNFIGIYTKFIIYNKILHVLSSILLGFFAMFFVKLIKDNSNKKINPFLIFLIVFAIALSVSTCWEIFEFIVDAILKTDLQAVEGLVGRNAILDTMLDICCSFAGSIISATICAVWSYKNSSFISKFTVSKIQEEKQETISQIEE